MELFWWALLGILSGLLLLRRAHPYYQDPDNTFTDLAKMVSLAITGALLILAGISLLAFQAWTYFKPG